MYMYVHTYVDCRYTGTCSMYVCINIYICIHTYLYTYINTYIYTYIYTVSACHTSTCSTTHAWVWHASFICVHGTFIYVTWLIVSRIHMCGRFCSLWHDSFICETWIIHVWDRPHSQLKYTGWRRPIRCHRWQVIFRKRATNYRALLREMNYKDKASYGSSPPCNVLIKFVSTYVCVVCECICVCTCVFICHDFWKNAACVGFRGEGLRVRY